MKTRRFVVIWLFYSAILFSGSACLPDDAGEDDSEHGECFDAICPCSAEHEVWFGGCCTESSCEPVEQWDCMEICDSDTSVYDDHIWVDAPAIHQTGDCNSCTCDCGETTRAWGGCFEAHEEVPPAVLYCGLPCDDMCSR